MKIRIQIEEKGYKGEEPNRTRKGEKKGNCGKATSQLQYVVLRVNGTYSQSFAPNCLRGEQIGALFNSHSFCTVVVDVESLEDLCGRKKGQLCSAIAFGSSLGALQRRIHVNFSCSPQEQRIFEETFTE